MKKSAAAALILMVLLFGGAYLTAMEPDAPAPETPQAQGDGEVVLTIKTGEAAERMTLRVTLWAWLGVRCLLPLRWRR